MEQTEKFKPFLLTKAAINRRVAVIILLFVLIISGVSYYSAIQKEWFPDIRIPILIVSSPYPGASPIDVEQLVTNKLETEFKSISGVKKLTSSSVENASIITLEFFPGANFTEAKNLVRDSIDTVEPDLPEAVEDITITEINLSETPIMRLNISGDKSIEDLKVIAEDIQTEVDLIPGILETEIIGGIDKEVQVVADPERMNFYGVTLGDIMRTISAENLMIPAGTLEFGGLNYMIRTPGEIIDPLQISDFIISSKDGVNIYVKDVANVNFSNKERGSISRANMKESISLSISKRSGENLQSIAQGIRGIVVKYEDIYKDEIEFSFFSDQSTQVDSNILDMENNIVTALIIVFSVLLFFMGFFNAFQVGFSIPVAMLISFIVLYLAGITLNIVVLFALVLALGMLVDNSIVVTENIFRYLQLGYSKPQAALNGASDVAWPMITSTLTTLAAFFPLIFMPGIIGDFMKYLPITLIVALSSSLFVALVLNPTVASILFKSPKKSKQLSNNIELLKSYRVIRVYESVIRFCLRFKISVIVLAIAIWVGILALFISTSKGVEFFPSSQPEEAYIKVEIPKGSSIEQADSVVSFIEDFVTKNEERYKDMISNIGIPVGNNQTSSSGVSESTVILTFPRWNERNYKPDNVLNELRTELEKEENLIPGTKVNIIKPQGGPPTGKAISVELRGDDLILLKATSQELQDHIRDTQGLTNLDDDFVDTRTEINVVPDREKMARYGLKLADISTILQSAIRGLSASEYRKGKDEYDIVVKVDEYYFQTPDQIGNLNLRLGNGNIIKLRDFADIKLAPGTGAIRHKGRDRVITVEGDAVGLPGAVVFDMVKEKVATFDMPDGVRVVYSGEDESRKESQEFIGLAFVIAIFLIFFILVVQFNSVALPLIVMIAILYSTAGLLLGLIIHSLPFSIIMGGIGMVALAGVAVNSAIILLDCIIAFRRGGMSLEDSVVFGCMTRLRPVFLTTTTTILGLLPITISLSVNVYNIPNDIASVLTLGSESGDIWKPMAYAFIYGLLVTSILTLEIGRAHV